MQSLPGEFVRSFELFHSLDDAFHLATFDNKLVLSPETLQSVLLDLVWQHAQHLDLFLHRDPLVLLLHDTVLHGLDVVDLLRNAIHVTLGGRFREYLGLKFLHLFENVRYCDILLAL